MLIFFLLLRPGLSILISGLVTSNNRSLNLNKETADVAVHSLSRETF